MIRRFSYSKLKKFFPLLSVSFAFIFFQNCAQSDKYKVTKLSMLTSGPISNGCIFNGQPLANGQTVTAYQNSTVPNGQSCVSEDNNCTNGVLSSAYNYASCSVGGPAACLFNGLTVTSGQTVTAYQNSTVPFGQACVSEVKTCTNGSLSGSYNYASCAAGAPSSCLFNGQSISNGQTVTGYQNSTVPFGQTCMSEVKTCSNGSLSGSYTFASCSVGAAASCSFNGQSVANGQTVIAFQNSTVPFGQTCVSEVKTCTNGSLSGSYNQASCTVGAPASCSFNGQAIANGQTVTGYQNSTVPYGQTCVSQLKTCSNGSLSGSYTFPSCSMGTPASCTFNGQAVASGQTITAFQNSTVPYGQSCVSQVETCTNGVLSGSFTFPSCTPGTPASCSFNGQTIASGQSITSYQNSTVPYGQACVPQVRTCTNGSLSGSYNFSSCSTGTPASCTFNGQTIASGQSFTAYQSSSVPYGQSCLPQVETCTNGTLNGSYSYASCSMGAPASCLFNGQSIASGQTVTAYLSSTVPYGQSCALQARTCSNGSLSGNYTFPSCSSGAPASCSFNGQTIASGQSVTAYQSSSVMPGLSCTSQTRTCSNGALSGSYSIGSCSVLSLPAEQNNYRFYKATGGKHFITLSFTEPPPPYVYEGVAYRSFVSSVNVANPIQIFRCYAAWMDSHFVSFDPLCEGTNQEGSLGFIYASQTTNSVPLYRFYTNGDHLITTTYSEGVNNGYALEGILGYVPTN